MGWTKVRVCMNLCAPGCNKVPLMNTKSDSQNTGEQLEEPEPMTASRPAPSPPRTMVLRGGPSQAVVEGVSASTRERLEQLLEFIEQSDHPDREMLAGVLLALAQEFDVDLTVQGTP